ncbi:uncharacterized protein LOC116603703 [Nematostella vectensis]|uniref:uncharacterized protein LOC116603703 n=1 Tax=Nematostella vectensis TaxID=45351 RepID=UPI002077871E|nr:uncharacterized protein LOC116603703 [Nematostella vectensis]
MSRIDLYFFDGQRKKKKWKRYRKPPELLPFSVRLTGLSGAVRVEAYLKQQRAGENKPKEPAAEKIVPESKSEISAEENPGQAGGEQNQVVLNNLYKLGNELKEEFGDKKLDKKALRLPNISFKNLQGNSGIKSFEQLEGDDEEENTQRFLFEENKFAAPNLLAQLAKLLDFIHGKQVEELEDILSTSGQLADDFNPALIVEEPENEVSETLKAGGVVVALPDELRGRLLNNFDGLSSNAVYVKREWQTTSYREQAILQKRLGFTPIDSQRNLSEGQKQPDTKIAMSVTKSDAAEKTRASESKDSIKKKKSEQIVTENTKRDMDSEIPGTPATLDSSFEGPQILNYRRDSRSSTMMTSRPRTRLERFKYYSDKSDGNKIYTKKISSSSQFLAANQKINVGPHEHYGDDEQERDLKDVSDVPSVHNTGQPTSINFSLLSRTCEDKGWIIHPAEANDLERQTLIEWARARLLQSIKEKEEALQKAKELGEDGPVVQKFYGDAQLEAAMKYKKGVSWAKRWKKISEDDKRMKFLITIPDGTSYCYYPSGRVAICVIYPGTGLPGKYTLVYGDSESQPLLGVFTPSGHGCTYHNDGSINFVATHKFGSVIEEDGTTQKKWKWPLGKLQSAVVVHLNTMISLRCVSHSSITLYYNCQSEHLKFQVGLVSGAKAFKVEDLGYLQTEHNFTSLSALQSIKVKPKKKEGKRKRAAKQAKADVISEEVLEQRQKELEEKFPERRELETDAPWQMDLFRLQRKVKNLVYDWMEHYRISVGITAPFRASSRAQRRRSLAHSARSLPGSMPSDRDLGRKTPQGRSPSAPPIPRAKALTRSQEDNKSQSPQRACSSTSQGKTTRNITGEGTRRSVTVDIAGADGRSTTYGRAQSTTSGSPAHSLSPSRAPFRCGVVQQPRPTTPPRTGCCLALRAEVLGEKDPQCRCDRRKIPVITDLEYDVFISDHVPRTQLVVVSVTSSLYPDANPCDSMLDQLYYEKNRNRSIPCVQARNDPYILLRYDISTAAQFSSHTQPLLLRRHNAVPGMFLMYTGGKLLFADHIFNGYGNAKRDFLKQITRTRKEALEGKALPSDFRLSPTRGRSGPRAAWGGEIGGVKMTSPPQSASVDHAAASITRIRSGISNETYSSTTIDLRGGGHSAASFVNLGLSINSPYPIATKRMDSIHNPVRDVHTVA